MESAPVLAVYGLLLVWDHLTSRHAHLSSQSTAAASSIGQDALSCQLQPAQLRKTQPRRMLHTRYLTCVYSDMFSSIFCALVSLAVKHG